jgi:ABC-2 type transport system ATP-binding protein
MSVNAIDVSSLTKVFSSKLGSKITALDGVSFSIAPGELFGLLGPNGAGKTTTVKIILGLTFPTSGEARVFGIPVTNPESRRRVGYLPEGHRFPGYLTARETLSIFGRMSGMEPKQVMVRAMPLLERLRIEKWIDVRVKKFSKGMVQRLGIAASLIHEPDILLLDEPTDGVDPVGRREIRDLLREEAHKGRAVLVNSHLLSEIELTCDRVAVLRKGVIAAQGTIDSLTRQESVYKIALTPMSDNLAAAFREAGATIVSQNGSFQVAVRDVEQLNQLIDKARSAGAMLTEVSPVRSTLEDVFVDLVRAGDAAQQEAAQ